MVGLEIDDQDFGWRDHEAVDLARDEGLFPARKIKPADDRDLGPAAFGKYGGESRIGDQRKHLFGKLLALRLVPGSRVACEKLLCRVAAPIGRELRQRLQQAMH